jgi:ornithine cyclodeaminase
MKIITLAEIKEVLPNLDLLPALEVGFIAYSAGQAVVPPVGELLLKHGEVHIKYGYLEDGPYYVVKIASGFYGNSALGLPSGNGLMLVFSQRTGALVCVLLDEGHLTDVRTALAGAIAARVLAPQKAGRIGIVGTGIQARLQLVHLKPITACREVLVWGRGAEQLSRFSADIVSEGFRVASTQDAGEILRSCNLVVTTTPSTEALLFARDLQSGTHITAVGSDTPHKQELDPAILQRADLVVADSIPQCLARGEIFRALQAGFLTPDGLVELGEVLAGNHPGRTAADQITVADLTGVAVQDIQIATAVYKALEERA